VGAGRQGVGGTRRLKAAERDQLLLALEQQLACRRLLVQESAALLADEFVEFGASGKVWNKQEIVAAMARWQPIERTFEDFAVRELGPSLCLVTYRLIDVGHRSSSLRSSLWRYDGESWRMIFHQGTLVK
jgi:hypothetical protein